MTTQLGGEVVQNPSSKATQKGVSIAGKDDTSKPQVNEHAAGVSAKNIIPGLSLARTIGICSHPDTPARNSTRNNKAIIPGNCSPIPQVSFARHSSGRRPNDIIPGVSVSPTDGRRPEWKDCEGTKEGGNRDNCPLSVRASLGDNKTTPEEKRTSRTKQIIPGTIKGGAGALGLKERELVPGLSVKNPTPSMHRTFSTEVPQAAQSQQKIPKSSGRLTEESSFSCELCKRGFSSRQGLFVHFGKVDKHLPCKHKDGREICLKVFDTEAKLMQHKKSHKS